MDWDTGHHGSSGTGHRMCVFYLPVYIYPLFLHLGLCSGMLAHVDCIKRASLSLASGCFSQWQASAGDWEVRVLTPWLPPCQKAMGSLSVLIKTTNFQQSVLFIKPPSQLPVTTPSPHLPRWALKGTRHHKCYNTALPLVVSLDPAHSYIDSTF